MDDNTGKLRDLEVRMEVVESAVTKMLSDVANAFEKNEDAFRSAFIEARTLVIADEEGRPRILIGVMEDGSPGIHLLDTEGKSRAMIMLEPAGAPGILFNDPDGRSRMAFSLADGENANLNLLDENGRLRLVLGSRPDGSAAIGILDKDGNVTGKLV